MSPRHQEGLAHLLYGITEGGGFVALTGEVGTGKTTLCRCLLQELPQNIDIALILNPKMNAIELLATICDELAVPYDKHRPTLKTLVDTLNQHLLQAHASGRRTVLLIDEAQNLSMEVLEQLRLLTNLETSKTKLLQIILVGQPELKQLLKRQDLRQLNQRITARYHLLPLSSTETRSYIRHRLQVCSGDPGLFNEKAIKKIHTLSSGIPRLINILCDRALLGAYANEARVITPRLVHEAGRETLARPDGPNRRPAFLLALLLSSTVLWGVYHIDSIRALVDAEPAIPPPPKSVEPEAGPIAIPDAKSIKFSDWLENPALTLATGLKYALTSMGHPPNASDAIDCESLAKLGFACMFGRTTWQDLLTINRPAILEFSVASGDKRHALFTGLKNGRPTLRLDGELTFPLGDVLSYWNGYYLILWRLPIPGLKTIFPGQYSDQVLWLRQQLTVFDGLNPPVKNPRYFDPSLKIRVQNFQHRHHLNEDGIAGLQTIFFLDNQSGSNADPRLIMTD
ncbi:MAG: AAA family ATPase [Gammaproteobacteria bacterium]